MNYPSFFAGIGASFAVAIVVMLFLVLRAKDEPKSDRVPVDPWGMQRYLHHISGQACPEMPELNATGVLYFALMMEELSETGDGLCEAIDRAIDDPNRVGHKSVLTGVAKMLHLTSGKMARDAVDLRQLVAQLPHGWQFNMRRDEVIALLDGTTDVAVVNCGFATAMGLPGAEAYRAVNKSNLSKANPDTGIIDKTPDGKWIKGRYYHAPDLNAVLDAQRREYNDRLFSEGMNEDPEDMRAYAERRA